MDNLIEIRKSLGMTQQKLADELGIAQPYLSQIEKGKVGLSFRMFEKLRAVLAARGVLLPANQHTKWQRNATPRPQAADPLAFQKALKDNVALSLQIAGLRQDLIAANGAIEFHRKAAERYLRELEELKKTKG
jgi:transcriptional regulator with XRE-family HTH domain